MLRTCKTKLTDLSRVDAVIHHAGGRRCSHFVRHRCPTDVSGSRLATGDWREAAMLVHSRGLAQFDSLLSWIDCNVASTSSSPQLGRYSTSVFHGYAPCLTGAIYTANTAPQAHPHSNRKAVLDIPGPGFTTSQKSKSTRSNGFTWRLREDVIDSRSDRAYMVTSVNSRVCSR
ncbi:hypothetical protein ASPSYDRAFT_35455 [Aspergillus sydowii CBS 593.65]|uniref:Uncharacterized protein n=1 Tax=Aspergillus sydowii CBS 593.65 TaxID=1036612 RepID=A0A1L9T5Z5_9EURO|nr:uncharacterized protein ASPSYDRAFT_35455 [Aspergillus sydowii CBS 593.65]OJJ54781.1 hypothetical protein ASPSYDRAFT_35455 [Aspergillus sydowii CBS 593.65]